MQIIDVNSINETFYFGRIIRIFTFAKFYLETMTIV